jgi:hypothetical protein
MKLSGFASLLAVAVAFSAAGIGCEDDVPTPKRDASAGRDGSADRGPDGAGGRDGSVDTGAGGSGGADAAVDRVPDGSPDSPVDAPVTVDAPPDTQPADTASPDTASPDTASPDTASPDTASPDTATDATTVVTECEDIPCPALIAATSQCLSDDVMCTVRDLTPDAGPETRNICLMNGVKKQSTETDNGFSIAVNKAAGGLCYTLEIDIPGNAPELWIYKAPGGAELARVSVDGVNNRSILTCTATGATFDVTNAGCDGLEGEGDGCATDTGGTCVFP